MLRFNNIFGVVCIFVAMAGGISSAQNTSPTSGESKIINQSLGDNVIVFAQQPGNELGFVTLKYRGSDMAPGLVHLAEMRIGSGDPILLMYVGTMGSASEHFGMEAWSAVELSKFLLPHQRLYHGSGENSFTVYLRRDARGPDFEVTGRVVYTPSLLEDSLNSGAVMTQKEANRLLKISEKLNRSCGDEIAAE